VVRRRQDSPTPASLAVGLLTVSTTFHSRLPELFAGHGSRQSPRPPLTLHPAEPQAWAATSVVFVLRAALGLDADGPGGKVTMNTVCAQAYGLSKVSGLQVCGGQLNVTVAADGSVETTAPQRLSLAGT
jgi:hypothetical protein